MSGHTGYIPSGLIVYLIVSSMLDKAKASRVKRSGPVMIFDATLTTKVLIVSGAIGSSIGSVYLALTTPDASLGVYVFAGLAVMCSIAFPSTISITKEGVQEHQWWGKSTIINWGDIRRIEYHKGPSTTVLFGISKRKIAHSGFHRDPETFQSECLKHTHLKLLTSSY
ncbi:MAG: hypothetical protein ABSF70_07085 [Terracidiphilus sp.]